MQYMRLVLSVRVARLEGVSPELLLVLIVHKELVESLAAGNHGEDGNLVL